MDRYVTPVLAFVIAILAAILIASVAHYDLGIPRLTIRTDALAVAAFIGSALATRAWLERKK
jgi:hypothetical protein